MDWHGRRVDAQRTGVKDWQPRTAGARGAGVKGEEVIRRSKSMKEFRWLKDPVR